MSKLNLVLVNGGMNLEIIALIGNNALLHRLNDGSMIVVNGLNIHDDFSCEWNFAYGYFNRYDEAFLCFNDKILKPYQEYEEIAKIKPIE